MYELGDRTGRASQTTGTGSRVGSGVADSFRQNDSGAGTCPLGCIFFCHRAGRERFQQSLLQRAPHRISNDCSQRTNRAEAVFSCAPADGMAGSREARHSLYAREYPRPRFRLSRGQGHSSSAVVQRRSLVHYERRAPSNDRRSIPTPARFSASPVAVSLSSIPKSQQFNYQTMLLYVGRSRKLGQYRLAAESSVSWFGAENTCRYLGIRIECAKVSLFNDLKLFHVKQFCARGIEIVRAIRMWLYSLNLDARAGTVLALRQDFANNMRHSKNAAFKICDI
jgi:hypothetical protein